jgi:nucleotide-binding universal stress UspA family protein
LVPRRARALAASRLSVANWVYFFKNDAADVLARAASELHYLAPERSSNMRILLAVDGSEHSDVATESLLARPWPRGTSVRVLAVAQVPFVPVDAFGGVGLGNYNYELLTPALLDQGQKVVERSVAHIREAGLSVEGLVARGDARAEIVRAATEMKADLVVVGSHGRTGLQRWVLGSVAEYVVRHAPCSVEVARRASY